MPKTKIYTQFFDVHNNEYNFNNYLSFASFWFGLPKKLQIANFPEYKKLQNAAANSVEARTKMY